MGTEPDQLPYEKPCLGDVFVDVGANIGYFSLLTAKLVGPTGKVLAIEAAPFIFEKLFENIQKNGLQHIHALNLAVSDTDGVASIYAAPEANVGETKLLETEGID